MPQEIRIGVNGITCASCVARVERAVVALPGVLGATVNLGTESATVKSLPDTVSRERIAQAIREAEYEPAGQAQAPGQIKAHQALELAGLRRDLALAAAFTLPLLLVSMGPMFLPGLAAALHGLAPDAVWGWAQLILASPMLLWAGRRFLSSGGLGRRRQIPALCRSRRCVAGPSGGGRPDQAPQAGRRSRGCMPLASG